MFTVLKGKPKSSKDFDAIRIKLASPEKIREWSHGEVKKAETINYRTFKPERDGLFCAKIFGPIKDYECLCGKYKRQKYEGIVCEKCGVEVTKSKVRRERMGHIELAAPVAHIWYLRSVPSIMASLLDVKLKDLERVIYYESYIVIESEVEELPVKTVLNESQYRSYSEKYGIRFTAEMGASAIQKLLRKMDLDLLILELKDEIESTKSEAKKKKLIKRMRLAEQFKRSGNKPEWMILDVLPVLPPDLRPLVSLEGGRFASSDLNDLYRRVINRNNRLKRLMELGAPSIIIRNEKRMLQEAVDALIDNGRRKQVVRASNNRPLKSLSESIRGKEGRFRRNLLGKRVDYSGRSVIVSGPNLRMDQCGLPKIMALELFKPFIHHKLIEEGYAQTVKAAKKMVERKDPEVWNILEDVVKEHPILLNRAPTLHRLSIQAFHAVLTDEKAIRLHPLVCPAFNADFDGDQMAVHVPLSTEAVLESEVLMLATENIISPAHGNPIAMPSQDMVLGVYYMTKAKDNQKGEGMVFSSPEEVRIAYENGVCSLNAKIKVRVDSEIHDTTVGRILFYEIVPKIIPFKDVNKLFKKKDLNKLISYLYKHADLPVVVKFLDDVKDLGFETSTRAGVSISIEDMVVPEEKSEIISKAEEEVRKIQEDYRQGLLTDKERYNKSVDIWSSATDRIAAAMMKQLGGEYGESFNSIYIMADSGARGSQQQMRQLAGVRGLMAKPSGDIIETPIKSNFKEGLTVLEYFTSTHGARKGLADTALKTANAGYLTRKLVDVAQDVTITMDDCGTTEGIEVSAIMVNGEEIESLADRILGRTAAEDIVDPFTNEVIVEEGNEIDEEAVEKITAAGIRQVRIFSTLTCKAERGVCAKCYGRDLARSGKVNVGEAVGIIAAQSIGEPGTQLTLRTFHVGGTASRLSKENKSAETKRAGIVRFFNFYTALNSDNERVLLSRRDAALLVTEPQIVSINKGRVNIEEDKAYYYLRIGSEEYKLKKVDFVNQEDIIAGGANAIGKYIFSVKDGDEVESLSLLVERVLEIFDVPKKIPYAAKVFVENGQTIKRFVKAEEGGKVKLIALEGDGFVEIDTPKDGVINRHGTHVVIMKNNEEKVRYYVPKGSKLYIKSGDTIESGTLIVGYDDEKKRRIFESDPTLYISTTTLAEWDAYSDYLLAGAEGYVKWVDLIPHVTIKEEVDKITSLKSNVVVESKDLTKRPRIEIVDENGKIKKFSNINEDAMYYIPPGVILQKENGEYVRAGDVIGKIPKELDKTTDITGGLPRVSELFEAKKPKNAAIISEISGVVSYGKESKGKRKVIVTSTVGKGGVKKEYLIPRNKRLLVFPGDRVEMGEPLTDGAINPHDILAILGERELQKMLVSEIQQVYKLQGVSINDKHIEIIVRQMLSKVVIEDAGDSDFIEGEVVNRFVFTRKNEILRRRGKKPAIGRIVLLGITKASLNTDSFISAASFQETTRVLTEASISGQVDYLRGLKENVIVGRLIPVGTGQKKFDEIILEPAEKDEQEN
ncbi:DNA-directed RNA polymerase subunit beta' [Hippea maritima]|uniref:DNA-directed RNA polymerase subunit beta' n=1 Tax=Hippea maritima (strain ATCC 700847 / DSM 10411 / MH2) TaxID=760142 RepID=F2LXU8_HIPMA|nr:DNA-directed RNA polymerase subunit beta' [Hippea maritima]AEA34339.1 DNA-directed RNA polymerase subunit beta' [Hippea maritima DSM 10411]